MEKQTEKTQVNTGDANKKILGVYPQRQTGLYMQRIKVFGGRITWQQWRTAAGLAERYSNGNSLHLTTRQDIELHNVLENDLSKVQDELNNAGLTSQGAGGDTVRNITVCTRCGLIAGTYDVFTLSEDVRKYLWQMPGIWNLARKFKITFCGCGMGCTGPYVNDIGFVVNEHGHFDVIGAGSLGARPSLGIDLYKNLSPNYVTPLCAAAIKLFEDYGNRQNRLRARLRHVREKLGNEIFAKELEIRFIKEKQSGHWPDVVLQKPETEIELLYRLNLPNGNIPPADAIKLADIAEAYKTVLRINCEHGLEIYGQRQFELPENLAELSRQPVIIACPAAAHAQKVLLIPGRWLPRYAKNSMGNYCPI